jgi:hypothetical protein
MHAMGIPCTAAHGTIRFSLSRYNSEAEIDRVIAADHRAVAQTVALLERYRRQKRPSRPSQSRLRPGIVRTHHDGAISARQKGGAPLEPLMNHDVPEVRQLSHASCL